MFNYVLNKDQSKTYVRYYKENNDMIDVKYNDGTVVSVENNDSVKRRLNRIQEEQIKEYTDNYDNNIGIILAQSAQVTGALLALQIMSTIALGGIGCIFFGLKSFAVVFKVMSLGYAIPALYLAGALPTKINSLKFDLFLKYKDRLNDKIDELNEEAEAKINKNTINKVEVKKIKNLCINDINFMSYFKLKSMTRAIDKEERKFERELKKEQLKTQRARDLGIDSNKILVKKRNKK